MEGANETKDIDNRRTEELLDKIQRYKQKIALINERYMKELEMRKSLDNDFRLLHSIKQEYEEVIRKFSSHQSMKKILKQHSKKKEPAQQSELTKATEEALVQSL